MDNWCVIILLTSFFLQHIYAHPQCLDFYPPFKSKDQIGFCDGYTEYGCCNSALSNDLKYDYEYVLRIEDEAIVKECSDSLKELMCAQCHPYASHIFDAEINFDYDVQFSKRYVNFPGLCSDFCEENFHKCRHLWVYVSRNQDFREFMLNATASKFCSWANISDPDYCFPSVQAISEKNDDLIAKSDQLTTLCVQPLYGAYSNPLLAVSPLDGTHRLFIGEQRGLVFVRYSDDYQEQEPFLDISERVLNSGSPWDERGLLGLTFHPAFSSNGRFFVYYSTWLTPDLKDSNLSVWEVPHKIRISEFTLDSNNPNKANHSSEMVILEVAQPEPNHDGGMLMFGDDGYLYAFIGDGGGAGDRHGIVGNALNMSTLLGKVVRIDIDSENEPYTVPPDNPYVGRRTQQPEIYASGIRNIWRCSKDRGDVNSGHGKGRIFCGDVGQNKFEEINIIKKGANYGWRAFEGFDCFDKRLCTLPSMKYATKPILVYSHDTGKSVVGGYVYRGCRYPNMYGKYIYGDTVTGRIFIASENDTGEWSEHEVVLGNSSMCNNGLSSHFASTILSFGEEENGEIVILSTHWPGPHNNAGRIYRLVDPARRADPDKCRKAINGVRTPPNVIPRSLGKK